MVLHGLFVGARGTKALPSADGPVDEQDDTSYAISANVPVCAIWNLLDGKSEESVPIMTIVEWLKFVQGRS